MGRNCSISPLTLVSDGESRTEDHRRSSTIVKINLMRHALHFTSAAVPVELVVCRGNREAKDKKAGNEDPLHLRMANEPMFAMFFHRPCARSWNRSITPTRAQLVRQYRVQRPSSGEKSFYDDTVFDC